MIGIADIQRWVEAQGAKSGWHRALTAFVFGFAGALAFPPTNFFPALAISFPALILLLRGASNLRSAFLTGWSFAFGYFLLGLCWIAVAMFVDIREFWWAVPLAVAGLPALCAIYYGLAAMLVRGIGLNGIAGALFFSLFWFVADYARGNLFTGFPWNLEGYTWTAFLPMMQIVSVTGIYGLTLLTVICACLPAVIFRTDIDTTSSPASGRRAQAAYAVLMLAVVVMVSIFGWGYTRLSTATEPLTTTRIRVVQPNVEQAHKWAVSEQEIHFQQLLNFTSSPVAIPPVAVIWPETASTYYLGEDIDRRRAISQNLAEGQTLLTGVIRRDLGPDGHIHYANALVAIDRTSRIVASYDKVHLVPFGEYIPFRRILPIRTLANLGVDFTAGEVLATLRLPKLPAFSPLICYEAIFPGEVARHDERPQFLLNVTNDGWYGHTAGPYQHYASARTRAIEEGLPLVRSANTGISAVVDSYGRSIVELGLGMTGFVDAYLPQPLLPTLFVKYGEWSLWIVFGLCAGIAVLLRRIKL